MFFLLSGEGATDIGTCVGSGDVCRGEDFAPGPMCVMVEQVVFAAHKYSMLGVEACGCVSKSALDRRAGGLKRPPKSVRLPGVKRSKETRYHFDNARVLAHVANEQRQAQGQTVVPILFRDSDGTASAASNLWADKLRSMLDGFAEEGIVSLGVPMVPRPKSEAWLLCGLKAAPYQNCAALEAESGNDASPNSLKRQLAAALGVAEDEVSRDLLTDVVRTRRVDIDRIDMPSFQAFHERLLAALKEG